MKRMLLLCVILACTVLNASNVILPGSFNIFSNEDIGSVCQDEYGALWITSGSNLYRHNSNSAVLIDGPHIGNNITSNGKGTLYTVKLRNLLKISTKTHKSQIVKIGIPLSNSTALLAESDSLWIGNGCELFLLKGEALSRYASVKGDESIRCILRSSDGLMLAGSSSGAVYSLRDSTLVEIDKRGNPVTFLFEDSKREKWVACGNDVVSLDKHFSYHFEGQARTICETGSGELLIGSTAGLFKVDTNRFAYKLDMGLSPNEPVTCLMTDRDGAAWIGTYYEGLRYFDNGLIDFRPLPSVYKKVKDIIPENDGSAYVLMDGEGMYYARKNGTASRIRGTEGTKLHCGVRVKDRIYVGNYDSELLVYNIPTKSLKRVHFGAPKVNVFCIEYVNGQIAVGTNVGVYLFEPEIENVISRKIAGFDGMVYDLSSDGNGLWIGSNGLYRSDDLTSVYAVEKERTSPVSNKKCCSFELQDDGSLLMAVVGAGICVLKKDGTKTFYDKSNCPLPTNNIIMCSCIGNGLILAGHSNGLVVINTDLRASNVYDAGSGLPISSLKGGLIRKQGDLIYIGGKSGVITADRNAIHFNYANTDFRVDRLLVGTEEKLLEDNVTLRHNENNLSFCISSYDFNPTSCPEVQCKLEGFDKSWKDIPSSKIMEYQNLTPGSYTFRIRSSNNEGPSVRLKIKPVWYMSAGCKALWILICLLLILWILYILYSRVMLRERLRNQVKLTEERNNLFVDISHKLRTPLTMILGQMELFFNSNKEKFPGRGHIESSYENALKMRTIISEFVDFENSALSEAMEFSGGYSELTLSSLSLRGKTMLIVDDNREIRLLLRSIFGAEFNIEEADNGEKGLEKAGTILPDIIISDVMMPQMDGIEMTDRLRKDPRTQAIPIVLLTAHASEKHNLEGLLVGADDYVTKPFSNELLKARVLNLVRGREKRLGAVVPEKGTLNRNQMEFLNAVIFAIERNIPSVNVSVLCKALGMSRTNLGLKMRDAVGMSPREYIEDVKLRIATNMLQEGVYNISEISDRLGFNNANYFTLRFKEKYGCTPSKYKKNNHS